MKLNLVFLWIAIVFFSIAAILVLVSGHFWKPPLSWFLFGMPFFALSFVPWRPLTVWRRR